MFKMHFKCAVQIRRRSKAFGKRWVMKWVWSQCASVKQLEKKESSHDFLAFQL